MDEPAQKVLNLQKNAREFEQRQEYFNDFAMEYEGREGGPTAGMMRTMLRYRTQWNVQARELCVVSCAPLGSRFLKIQTVLILSLANKALCNLLLHVLRHVFHWNSIDQQQHHITTCVHAPVSTVPELVQHTLITSVAHGVPYGAKP